jgi:hypothetical protein
VGGWLHFTARAGLCGRGWRVPEMLDTSLAKEIQRQRQRVEHQADWEEQQADREEQEEP